VYRKNHFFRKPCVVLRKETEWIELITNGTARLVDADPVLIKKEFTSFMHSDSELHYPAFYGDGKSAEFILNEILFAFGKD